MPSCASSRWRSRCPTSTSPRGCSPSVSCRSAVSVFLILQTTDYKRLFAYSTIEHMGIILAAVGLGGTLASYGAMFQILTHAVTKAFCFLAAGSAVIVTNTQEIASVRGLLRTSPVAGVALLVGRIGHRGSAPVRGLPQRVHDSPRRGVPGTGGRGRAPGRVCVVGFVAIMVHVNRMVFGVPTGAPAADPSPRRVRRGAGRRRGPRRGARSVRAAPGVRAPASGRAWFGR